VRVEKNEIAGPVERLTGSANKVSWIRHEGFYPYGGVAQW
jgi:hypothetical protein